MKAVILAAGRGSRLEGLTDDLPKCMVSLAGTPLLHRQISALKEVGIEEVAVVRGYRAEAISGPDVHFIDNPRWSQSNMVVSLQAALPWLKPQGGIISYADIFYAPEAVTALMETEGDLVLTYDVNWQTLWESRQENPLDDAETFKLAPNGDLKEIGKQPQALEEVEGQYMGLLRFTGPGIAAIEKLLSSMTQENIDRLDMTSLLSLLLESGERIVPIAYEGEWGEVDTKSDLELYEQRFAEKAGL